MWGLLQCKRVQNNFQILLKRATKQRVQNNCQILLKRATKHDKNILSMISICNNVMLYSRHWRHLDIHLINILYLNMFDSKWTSYRIFHQRGHLSCDIALRNPFSPKQVNDSTHICTYRAFNIFKCTCTSLFRGGTFIKILTIFMHSFKSGGTKDHLRHVKVPGTTSYWKACL